jgi:hypothetical protein
MAIGQFTHSVASITRNRQRPPAEYRQAQGDELDVIRLWPWHPARAEDRVQTESRGQLVGLARIRRVPRLLQAHHVGLQRLQDRQNARSPLAPRSETTPDVPGHYVHAREITAPGERRVSSWRAKAHGSRRYGLFEPLMGRKASRCARRSRNSRSGAWRTSRPVVMPVRRPCVMRFGRWAVRAGAGREERCRGCCGGRGRPGVRRRRSRAVRGRGPRRAGVAV